MCVLVGVFLGLEGFLGFFLGFEWVFLFFYVVLFKKKKILKTEFIELFHLTCTMLEKYIGEYMISQSC